MLNLKAKFYKSQQNQIQIIFKDFLEIKVFSKFINYESICDKIYLGIIKKLQTTRAVCDKMTSKLARPHCFLVIGRNFLKILEPPKSQQSRISPKKVHMTADEHFMKRMS